MEIFQPIAEVSIDAWRSMLSIPTFGRFSITPQAQLLAQKLFGKIIIKSNGTKKWYLNNKLHRFDGPAKEYSSGTKKWYLNNKLHRDGEPAIVHFSGTKEWYLNGELHRRNGPAIEYADGYRMALGW